MPISTAPRTSGYLLILDASDSADRHAVAIFDASLLGQPLDALARHAGLELRPGDELSTHGPVSILMPAIATPLMATALITAGACGTAH